MAKYKVTILMQCTTGKAGSRQRIGGFSESWYFDGTLTALNTAIFGPGNDPNAGEGGGGNWGPQGLIACRAACLPASGAVVGVRVQGIDPVTAVNPYAAFLPGSNNWPNDYPSLSLLLSVGAVSTRNTRRSYLRCIPDQFVVFGEYTPDNNFASAVMAYISALGSFRFRGKNLASATATVLTITAGGLVTLSAVSPFTVGDKIKYKFQGDRATGPYQVVSIGPLANQFSISGWTAGDDFSGAFTATGYIYPQVDPDKTVPVKTGTRKVGRPFDGFRGRGAKRPLP